MAETTTNNSILGDVFKGSTQGSTVTFPTADYTQPDTIYGWSDHIRQQKESCDAQEGCEWDSENERCNCYSDLTTGEGAPSPCDTASCPEGYTCKENSSSATGYDCISDAEYANTLEGYLDTVDLGGFCQGATSAVAERGQAGCVSAGGTWVDYESFFGPDYYKKISETFGFGKDDYSEFFPEFPFEAFENVIGKLPEYEGQQQALINRAFSAATADRKRNQALIDQAYKDGLIGIDQRDELLKSAFALQSVSYQQKVGTERYKSRIGQAYDEGIISVEEKNQLLSAIGEYEGTIESDMSRKLDIELEKKKQSLGGIQRQFQTSVSQLRGSLMGALPGIDQALGTQFAGSGYAKTAEQRVYEQSQDAFSNIIANTYIPEFEDIQSRYDLTTLQIKEETQEAMEQAYLKFAGDELAAEEAEQGLMERSQDIRLRKQQADAGLLTDAERDLLARDEAALNLRDEMDKRISEVDSILYDWLGQTLRQAGLTAEGIEEPDPDGDGDGVSETCEEECKDYDPNIYESMADCLADCEDRERSCENNDDCGENEECVDGVCKTVEEKRYACNDGVCEEDENGAYESEQACIDDGCGKCTSDNECGDDEECVDGACVKKVDDCTTWCSKMPEKSEAGVWVNKTAGSEWLKSIPEGCKAEDCGKKPPKDRRSFPVTPTAPTPPSARYGANFITSGPSNIMVGDNPGGRELVQVTPLGSPNTKGPKSFLDQLYKKKMNYSFNQNSILEDLYR